jgi:Nif11 domain
MSKEKLQAFADALNKSEELRKQLTSIQVEVARSTAEKLAKLSEIAGTPFTAEEYLESIAEASEELSQAQLQTVAGGVTLGEIIAYSAASFGFGCLIVGLVSELQPERYRVCSGPIEG